MKLMTSYSSSLIFSSSPLFFSEGREEGLGTRLTINHALQHKSQRCCSSLGSGEAQRNEYDSKFLLQAGFYSFRQAQKREVELHRRGLAHSDRPEDQPEMNKYTAC